MYSYFDNIKILTNKPNLILKIDVYESLLYFLQTFPINCQTQIYVLLNEYFSIL